LQTNPTSLTNQGEENDEGPKTADRSTGIPSETVIERAWWLPATYIPADTCEIPGTSHGSTKDIPAGYQKPRKKAGISIHYSSSNRWIYLTSMPGLFKKQAHI
jgi:hypothetical protein